jgi:hypothetical protein
MTTDNRTKVQIVADALRSMPEAKRDDDRDPAVVVAEYAVAALVAAQDSAPQEEHTDLIAKTFNEIHGDRRSFSHAEVKKIVYPLIDALRAQVPSSGVDVDELAEVIRKLRFDDEGCWADGIDCTESVSDHADVIARAVAEWLKGQER